MTVKDLPAKWREKAEGVRPFNAGAAEAFEQAAEELDRTVNDRETELVNLTQASHIGGYEQDYLGALLREGKIENKGRKYAPKMRRVDVPIKVGHRQP